MIFPAMLCSCRGRSIKKTYI